ncbi:MAG: PKD domain-containing protein [Chitinophagales bacterium]
MRALCFFLLIWQIAAAQNKYFEKQYVWNANFNNNGHTILQKANDNYVINGTTLDTSWVPHSFVMEIDNYGTVEQVKNYLDTEYATFSRTMIKNDDVYLLSGARQHQETYNVDAYIGVLDSDYNLNVINSENSEYNINIYGACQTQNGYLLAGDIQPYAIPNVPYSYLYLLKLDSLGNQVWDSIYYNYNVADNYLRNIIAVPNTDTYYISGSVNYSNQTGGGDLLLAKIDGLGNILWDTTYNFGSQELMTNLTITYNNGFLMTAYQDLNTYNLCYVIKMDENGTIEWQSNDYFFDKNIQAQMQTIDSNFLFTGYAKPDILTNGSCDMQLLKLSPDGELLWRRQYGGTDNDYGYDIIETSDGGYIVCGRTESNSEGADLYVVKTNCMGLLTEPQADFVGDLDHENIIATAYNESQYVYPDSIDGGHFVWDFGDNTPFIIANNTAPQTHNYTQAGKYTATLQAIVCNDTSIFKRIYCIGTTDATAIFEYENTGILGVSFSPQNSYHDATYIWHFGDENISYEQNPTHTYAQNGHYEVSLSIVLCNDTISFSQNILVDNVGFQENIHTENNDILIFPNPATNTITILVETFHERSKNYEIAIYNHSGQMVFESENYENKTSLNIQNLQQGSYFLHLKDEKSSIVKPFVIMK